MNRTLTECLELTIDRRGVTPKKLKSDWTDNGYRVLSANNVKTNGLQNIDGIRFIDEETYKKWMKEEIQRGDLLLTSEAPAGEVYYWDSDEKIVAGQRIYILRTKKDVDSLFLKYYIQSAKGQAEIRNKCSGSTVFGISAKTFDSIEIVLPDSLEEQKKISSFLYAIDKKINNNNKICENLDNMVKTIYQYWFLQFEYPNEDGKPYKSNDGEMVWNDVLKREIPKNWDVKAIGELISSERGVSYNSANTDTGEGIPMLNLATFMPGGGSFKAEGLKYYLGDYSQNKVLEPYELIMCNTQQTAIDFSTDIIGRAMLVPDIFDSDVISSHHVNVIRTKDKDLRYYLLYLFNSDFFHKYISGYANGTNILGLVFSGVEEYMIELPEKRLLKAFADIVLDAEKKKSLIFKENEQLASLRDFLLPMLINGQVIMK